MSAHNQRHQRIESQMQRALAELVPRAVKDPRVGNLTITAVSLLPDLSAARVWFLPFGTGRDAAAQLAGLKSAAGFLRGEVARQLGLRHAPRLEFELDTALERAQSLTQLISTAVAADKALEGAAASKPGPDAVREDGS
ncbi:MAG: 30S ribosome-binding factor RbfA [Gammaproteobacteria bacterium]|nr:30S ribosome-binding factor RbfA [Gammaproteobacteria bacterium]